MSFGESQGIEMRFRAVFVLGQFAQRPVRRENVGFAHFPQEVELVEVFFDNIRDDRGTSERRHDIS